MLCFFQNPEIWIFGKFLNFSALTLKKKSTVLDGFFPYLLQMITSMRGCVAYNDLWPWPIFSRSFGLENCVRSVASIVLDGFFPYLIQMITSMRRCVACDDLWPWPISSRSFDLVLTWDPTWLNSVGNHEAAGVSSERRRSSCSSLVCLETFITDAFIQNQHLAAVFFDLQKAYDTTWKCGILQDLYDMGLRGNLPIFIGKFLSDRTFQVHLGTILSDKIFHQEEGVPQGAILSTTLFNVKINDIVKQVDPGFECSLYVDDFVITSTVFKSRFNEVKQKYLDFCHIYTDGSKVETKVASAYVCPYGTRGYRLRNGCSIFTAEVEAINKALTYVKVSTRKSFVIFSDSMPVLQAIESQESKNPLLNRVLQVCQKILSNGKFITFCWLPSHRDIRGNEDADRAAKDALSKALPENF